jgi:hypothetical protein
MEIDPDVVVFIDVRRRGSLAVLERGRVDFPTGEVVGIVVAIHVVLLCPVIRRVALLPPGSNVLQQTVIW